ncbi:stalk domain-containing protein [Paenibacillus thalictri]|uniref:Copper amine oxidase-like N-terminal domain-containing protein n=1 Tax=Paenibacillus thalictri TaxID=2527873 RepID=A0A4Q9DKH1_9BACL|nr:stalk domain-containing protein [Paenibacillus thalictri]TBL72639.1 hypothetical protein EYB31_28200 [Paenibacillus thalictri]
MVRKVSLLLSVLLAAAWFMALASAGAAAKPVVWGAVQKATYNNLKYGALIINSPLSDGGFSLASGSVVKKTDDADFVLTTFNEFGARGVAIVDEELSDTTKTVPSLTRDHAKMEAGTVYFIMTHDGGYAKIRLDRVTSSLVTFSYVTEKAESTAPQPNPQNTQLATDSKPSKPADSSPSVKSADTPPAKQPDGGPVPAKPNADNTNGDKPAANTPPPKSAQVGPLKFPIQWGETRKASYSGLKYGALTINNPLSDGGFSIFSGKTVSNTAEADFVITTFTEMGGRFVSKVNESLPEPTKSITIQKPDHQKAEQGSVYIVKLSNGQYAKLQLDRLTNNAVSISYVLQENNRARTASTVLLQAGSNTAAINDQNITLDNKAELIEDEMWVPLRFFTKVLGVELLWDPTEQIPYLKSGDNLLAMTLDDSMRASVDTTFKHMDKPDAVLALRLMVPLKRIAESFGFQVEIDGENGSASVVGLMETTEPQTDIAAADEIAPFIDKPIKLRIAGAVLWDRERIGSGGTIAHESGVLSPGAATASVLSIRADGTYSWTNNVMDGADLAGTWEASHYSEYPIVLHHGESGKDWYLGASGQGTWGGGDVILWDRSALSYNGDFE